MISQVTQDKFYKQPTEDCRGNCQQAATASLLGLRLDDVPDFHDGDEDGFWVRFHSFIRARGFYVLALEPGCRPPGYYLAYGRSPRGVRHAVVYRDGELVWDPHPSRAGLVEVDEINLLIPYAPALMKKSPEPA